ncbi:hypothetical protein FVEG_17276 [Fusarium verticillioides 7600]|uniref:Uncharacterized protein n=1 Tax=Gibberella moniliformis (strain M3125 / FGSC 7600) TaxID=334819 RepID=W7MRT6_GIBM7|nr:hypothetical protein FVEG_17276 [Fusarium verticillioides 7600]EWG54188.1 hypothetical protein FVEG_17276 [Fusarium verticillioides 7600]
MSRSINCIGMKVDAYILNNSVVGDSFFLAPVHPPRYESLSSGDFHSRPDVEDPIDLSNASPWSVNPRIANIGTGQVLKSKLGVYLHWCLPKQFRLGTADADVNQSLDSTGPVQYEAVPDRWLIFRHIAESQPDTPALEIFLVEGNKVRSVSQILDEGGNPQSVSSPFIDRGLPAEDQIKTVLGQVSRLPQDWIGVENDPAHYRSPLTVLGSGNPLFADFIPYNSAVFSFHDDLTKEGGEPGSIESAKINYSVYGFFAKDALELASDSQSQSSTPVSVCWGSLHSVHYQRDVAPSKIKAAEKAQLFADTQPVGVGNDVMDACVALLRGSSAEEASMAEAFESLKSDASLQQSNSQLGRASIAATNFKGTHGGFCWRVKKQEEQGASFGSHSSSQVQQPIIPNAEQNGVLRQLNVMQDYLDALCRRTRYTRHLVFCEWWKHRSLIGNHDGLSELRRTRCTTRAKKLLEEMQSLTVLIRSAEIQILSVSDRSLPYGPFEKEETSKFFSHTDPAFVLRNMGSGWPEKWDSKPTTIDTETFNSWLATNAETLRKWTEATPFVKEGAPTTEARITDLWEHINDHRGLRKLPIELRQCLTNTMLAFIKEIVAETPGKHTLLQNPSWKECCWDGQPWLPLFVDWEVEYVNIPSRMWQLTYNDDGTVQYGLDADQKLSDLTLGSRKFSGRSILQPGGQKLILGLLDMMHRTVPVASDDVDPVKAFAEEFLSGQNLLFGRLDGFTDHLLTLCQGAHAIPTREGAPTPEEEIFAEAESLNIFYGGPADSSSGGLDVTPYGTCHEGLSYETLISTDAVDHKNRFFQPVTHGQARLTQFNIVDRFGQVICAHDPRPEQPKATLYPHIGSSLLCEPDGDASPNTAFATENEADDCEWFQLGPRINQDARMHAEFLCGGAEGDTAVFAWLLINFHNQSIQVYDGDRTFKGEAMLPSGPNESVHWHSLIGVDVSSDILPHMMRDEHDFRLQARLDKVDLSALKGSQQPMSLNDLIASMSHAPFIIGLWKTIVAAQDHIQAPPWQQFAQFPSALVGRPVALAHLSLGIELATPPMQSQAFADYDEDDNDSISGVGLPETGDAELTRYEFGIKLGDMLGHQDGLIGYFTAPDTGKAWNLVTDYAINDAALPNVSHSGDSPPLTLSPSYPPVLSSGTPLPFNITNEAGNYQKRKAEALQSSLVTVLLDPFLPIHVRSGILPAVQAQLNRNDVEQDLRNLGVWFRSGPVIIGSRGSDPVSSKDGKVRIQVISDGTDPKAPLVPVHTMPTTTSGAEWQWVQPVVDETKGERDVDDLTSEVRYVHLGVTNPLREGFDATVGADNEKAKEDDIEVAVALDGYLLLRPSKNSI